MIGGPSHDDELSQFIVVEASHKHVSDQRRAKPIDADSAFTVARCTSRGEEIFTTGGVGSRPLSFATGRRRLALYSLYLLFGLPCDNKQPDGTLVKCIATLLVNLPVARS